MKLILAAAAVLMTVAPVKPANYAGGWTLDASKSTGLPPYYAQVKSHKLLVTQTDKQLDVAVTVDAGRAEPDKMSFVYDLTGTETTTETSIRTPMGLVPVPTKLKAVVNADGGVSITILREFPMGGQTIRASTQETWKLSDDGKTLTVHRVDDSPRGQMTADMVFVRD